MTTSSVGLTQTDLIACASKALEVGGYRQISGRFPEWDSPSSRLFEDPYNIVALVVFDTCAELLRSWSDSQNSLSEVISSHVGREESKSWDGYLVLMTPGFVSSRDAEIEAIRYNTIRLRKLVATGDDLRSPSDVERLLCPLMPLGQETVKLNPQSSLDLLPRLLSDQKIPPDITKLFIEAFRDQSPMIERLHQKRGEK